MWKYLVICLLVAITSCTGENNNANKSKEDNTFDKELPAVNIKGQWDIENVVETDSSYLRPSEIEHGITAYIDFKDDNSFGIMTNCNSLGGRYVQSNDSIQLKEISFTEMACDNMELEELLKKVLPLVNTIDCVNDSITRLNCDKSDSYIVLKKRQMAVK